MLAGSRCLLTQDAGPIRRHTPSRKPPFDARREEAVTSIYRRREASILADLLTRTHLRRRPLWRRQVPHNLGPSRSSSMEGLSFVYKDVRGRASPRATSSTSRPTRPVRRARDTDEENGPWDRVDWMVKNLPQSGRVGHVRILVPGFIPRRAR